MGKIVSVDLGDTLVAFRPRKYELIYEVLREEGYENLSLKKVYRAYINTMAKYNFPDQNGVNPFDVREFLYNLSINPNNMRLVKKISEIDRGDEYYTYDDAIDFLEFLKSNDYSIALVSNATPRAKRVVRELNLDKYFDLEVYSFEVGKVKPNPAIFSIVIKKLGYPEYHIGDIKEMDVYGAKRAGIRSILLNRFSFYENEGIKSLKEVTAYLRVGT
ncbi:HAD family hydrolase [Stygiolobus caldivivus]|nr:HAD family hydrolase [Stygiolobus caldivivus]